AATMRLISSGPEISDVFASVDAIRQRELDKALVSLGDTDQKTIQIITDLTKSIVDSILPKPLAK
ncbi:hypothetical protein, partial [Undibacterium luofuense]|uniref:hypothetical protein n=1 Tax=Undibacterium luofuense TaxID=2828733 RepID=UPI0030EB8EA6